MAVTGCDEVRRRGGGGKERTGPGCHVTPLGPGVRCGSCEIHFLAPSPPLGGKRQLIEEVRGETREETRLPGTARRERLIVSAISRLIRVLHERKGLTSPPDDKLLTTVPETI
ncbi:unnamed protein product [Lota lota]